MSSAGYPVAAVVVGLLLGQLIETEMLRASQLAGSDRAEVLIHPRAIVIVGLMLAPLGFSTLTG
jgi:putative tricarboxylic transport membrane protein